MQIRTIEWKNNAVRIIDQTKLPNKFVHLDIKDSETLWHAIKELKVRGAPALGAAAGLGVYLGIKDSRAKNFEQFFNQLENVAEYVGSSRPTARNLFWGLERMKAVALANKKRPINEIINILFKETDKIIEEDRVACRKIGFYGEKLFKKNENILTVCNAGILATIDYGTALGVIYKAKEQGKNPKVYACETRPLLQGARLTVWELHKMGIKATLICDNMAATLMAQGKIDRVIAGADRIARNGDAANKIGTYNLAVLSHYHKIPFYIAAPESTFDLTIKSGKEVKIEERDGREITLQKGVKTYNPAFDVTPYTLITAIITDKGVIYPPYTKNIGTVLKRAQNCPQKGRFSDWLRTVPKR